LRSRATTRRYSVERGVATEFRLKAIEVRRKPRHSGTHTSHLDRCVIVLDPSLLSFIRGSIKSVWVLELLLLLRRNSPRGLTIEEAARELRGTEALVSRCLPQLEAAGLVAADETAYHFAPASPALQELCGMLEQSYRERPVAIVDAIITSQDVKLRDLAYAFRFKEKDE